MRKQPASLQNKWGWIFKNVKVIKGKRKSRVKGNKEITKQNAECDPDGILNGEKNNYKRYKDNRETLSIVLNTKL